MTINSTQSYTPSYTANYGAAQSAKSKAMTKVGARASVQLEQAPRPPAKSELVIKLGSHLNTKA
ncbi:MAG: hypothetical protein QM790_07665 [Nibricoccus sp.]